MSVTPDILRKIYNRVKNWYNNPDTPKNATIDNLINSLTEKEFMDAYGLSKDKSAVLIREALSSINNDPSSDANFLDTLTEKAGEMRIKIDVSSPEEKKGDPAKNPSNTMPAPGSAPLGATTPAPGATAPSIPKPALPPPETKAEAADDNKGSAVASGVLKEEIIHSEPLLRPEFIQVQTIEEETPEEELKEDKIYEAFSNNAFTEFQVGGNTQFVHKQPAWLNIDKYSIGSAMPIFEPFEKQFRVWDMLPFDRLPNNLKVQRLQKTNPRPNFDSPQADSDVFGVDPQYIYQNPPQASIDPLFNDVHTFEYVSIAGMN